MFEKFKETLTVVMLTPLIVVYPFLGPLTFVWLIYNDAQTNNSFLQWCALIFLDMILAAIWPIYWLIQLIIYLFKLVTA